jgi:hypothetical protein
VLATALIASFPRELEPHASEETREEVEVAPFTLTTMRNALSVQWPGMSARRILDWVALNVRLLVDACDGVRRGIEAALIHWEPEPE